MTVNNDGSCSQETRNSLSQKTQVRSCLWPWGSRGKVNSHSRFGLALSIEAAREHLEEFVISSAKKSTAHEEPNKVVIFSLCDDMYVYDTAFKIFVQWHLLTSITALGSTHLSVQLHSSWLNCCILLPARAFFSSIIHSSVIRSSPSPPFNTAEIIWLFPLHHMHIPALLSSSSSTMLAFHKSYLSCFPLLDSAMCHLPPSNQSCAGW